MGLFHSPSVLTSGLVLYLDAGNVKSYSGTGTAWTDLSSNAIAATLQNSGNGTVSGTSSYMVFNPPDMTSTAGYYLINDSRIATITTEITLESCVYLTTLYASGARPISPRTSETSSPIGFAIGTGNISWEINTNPTGWQTGSASNANCGTNKWIYVQQTTSVTTSLFNTYVNGALVGSLNFTGTPNTGNGLLIGRGFYSGVVNFAGYVAFVRYYNRALTAQEVRQNFNALRGRFGI